MKKILTAIALATVTLAQAQVFTNYTLQADSPNRGSFSIGQHGLWQEYALSIEGSYVYNYTYALFTPTVSGTYAFGIEQADYDPVMIVYQNQTSFPADPASNVIGFNDDWSGNEFNGLALVNTNNPWPFNINPVVADLSLSAGVTYLIAVTSYDPDQEIPRPITFFSYGPAAMSVGGPAVPEPSTYAAIFGAAALGGTMIWRRRKQA